MPTNQFMKKMQQMSTKNKQYFLKNAVENTILYFNDETLKNQKFSTDDLLKDLKSFYSKISCKKL